MNMGVGAMQATNTEPGCVGAPDCAETAAPAVPGRTRYGVPSQNARRAETIYLQLLSMVTMLVKL